MSAPRIVLVGMMGSGKTTVGRRLAARLGWAFVDSDEQVEARTGRTVRQIFEEDGEPAYRKLEAEALAAALSDGGPAVVAAAGGVVLDPANRRLLRQAGEVVWLDAHPDVLTQRATSGGDHRPLLEHDPARVMARLHVERRPLYEEVADHRIDVGPLAPDEVVAEIVARVAR